MAGGEEVTRDALLDGRLALEQPGGGYRANVDALWLAAFASGGRRARAVIDLGAGVGTIGLALLAVDAIDNVTLVEIDPLLSGLAANNARAFPGRVEVVETDLRAPLPEALQHRFDLVVANPPWAARPTRPSPDPRKARARTGDPDTTAGFVRAARAALGAAGRACFVYPAQELPHLLQALDRSGLPPKRLRAIHPLPDAPARAVLVEAKPARKGGLRVESPFVAMRAPGEWTDEAAAILTGAFSSHDAGRG